MLRREQEAYQSARFYIAMGRHNALSVVRDYGVDPRHVYVVRPGANMDEPAVQAYLAARGRSWREAGEPFTPDRPARLGLVGLWPERKGLPRLVAAAEVLARRGRPVKVNMIGNCPEHLRGHPQVEWVGVVNKTRELDRFLREVDRFALGCLPSHFEPLGISTLEALRLGVPVMGADTGGIPDCVPSGAGFLVPRDAGGEEIADAIEYHVFDPDRYAALQAAAVREAPGVTWEVTVQRFQEIWAGKARPFDPSAEARDRDAATGAGRPVGAAAG
jgi:starch synthase